MNRQNFMIGCLSLSALMLTIAIIVVAAFETRTAQASGMITTGGRYTMVVGRLDNATELVYVMDTQSAKLLAYRLNPNSGQIELTHRVDLDEGGAKPPGKPNLRP